MPDTAVIYDKNANPEIRATVLADLDVESWQAHSNAQEQEFESEPYYQFYSQFVEYRVPVEAEMFQINFQDAREVALWLENAAQEHDKAEYFQDKAETEKAAGNVENAKEYTENAKLHWRNVFLCLETRYLYAAIAKENPKILEELNMKAEEWNRSGLNLIEWLNKRSDLLFRIPGKFNRKDPNLKARLELAQWQSHHDRHYPEFINTTVELLKAFGLNHEDALLAAEKLAEGCQVHDKIEEEREHGIQNANAKDDWTHAKIFVANYYKLLLQGLNNVSTEKI